jgi:AraC-like DNA-binding protein
MLSNANPIPSYSLPDSTAEQPTFVLETLDYRNSYYAATAHRHQYHEIFLFETGGGKHMIDFQHHDILPSSIHIVAPGQVHQLFREAGASGSVLIFSETFCLEQDEVLSNLLVEIAFLQKKAAISFSPLIFKRQCTIVREIGTLLKDASTADPQLVRAYLLTLLLLIKKGICNSQPCYSSDQQRYYDFRVLLEAHFKEIHQVKDYAKILGFSTTLLSESVKTISGRTPLQFIIDRRLLEAKRLLSFSDLTEKEIAYRLHFNDPAHFGKFFRQKTGESPGQFRKAVSTMGKD